MHNDTVNWDDLRVAYNVACSGSLSRSAEQLSMNHSTVLRRINRLERALGIRLFIRHQRGYRLTEAGQSLLETMTPLSGDMQRLITSLSALENSPSGVLKLSTVSDFSRFFAPLLKEFHELYPQVRLQITATDDVLSLSRGDVHVSLRLGDEPDEPDLIARYLLSFPLNFYASDSYVERYGLPTSMDELDQHLWVLPTGRKRHIPGISAIADAVDPRQVVYQSNSFPDIFSAVNAGIGIGPVGVSGLEWKDNTIASIEGLHTVNLGIHTEPNRLWCVYHKDMRGNSRIQALLAFIQHRIPADQAHPANRQTS